MQTYDAKAVARLDRLYSTPQIVDQRRQFRAIISARPGEVGLDVGCGVAYLACELAREVEPRGRIKAIDNSQDSVAASKTRIAREGLERLVDVRTGDAADLQFPDETFDFVTATQVYCYVPDAARAVKEAARVLRKGGRLVILDSDWDMCIWESSDRLLTRRIIDARSAVQFAHANLPRMLHGFIRAAGMTLSGVQAFPIIETRYDPNAYSAGIIEPARNAALKHGIPPGDVAAWENDLRSRTSDGEWFFCLNRFVFTATK
ncbi:MAG: methyltransferase domain-containing protein [Betaproteobacteria bacterium]|nr:methyltransferase domain-containing protein [Betaproteobacteria bacterium]